MSDITTSRKPDRRIERTMNALRDALMSLIIEKGYDAISIQDIADRANVARATFYLHFKDKDDLMFRSMRAIYDQVVPTYIGVETWEELCSPHEYEHVAEYFDFYEAMLSPRGSMGFMTQVRAYLQDVMADLLTRLIPPGQKPRIPIEILAAYCTGAQIGLIWWWVENRMPIPAEQIAHYTMQISLHGNL